MEIAATRSSLIMTITLKGGKSIDIKDIKTYHGYGDDHEALQCYFELHSGEKIDVTVEDVAAYQKMVGPGGTVSIVVGYNNGVKFTTVVPSNIADDDLLEEILRQRKQQTGS